MSDLHELLTENDIFEIDETALVEINGKLNVDHQTNLASIFAHNYIRMGEYSRFIINGKFTFMSGIDLIIYPNAVLEMGNNSYINNGCEIRCKKQIHIGDNCAIGRHFCIMDCDFHKINGIEGIAPIIIEDHVWIGCHVTILKGVTIGEGSVIGAGSVVTKDIPKRCMAGGIPAKIIKSEVLWE